VSVAARMARLQDEDLVQIANGKDSDGFEPDFVEAAKAELRRRGLTDDAIGELTVQAEELAAFEEAQNDAPLSWPARIAFLLFGFTTVGIFFAIAQRFLGYRRKSKEAFMWALAGFGFWGLIGVAFVFVLVLADVIGA